MFIVEYHSASEKMIQIKIGKKFVEFSGFPEILFDPVNDMKITILGDTYIPSPIYIVENLKGWQSECPDLSKCKKIRYEFDEFSKKEFKRGVNQLVTNIKYCYPNCKLNLWYSTK